MRSPLHIRLFRFGRSNFSPTTKFIKFFLKIFNRQSYVFSEFNLKLFVRFYSYVFAFL